MEQNGFSVKMKAKGEHEKYSNLCFISNTIGLTWKHPFLVHFHICLT